MAGFLKVSYLLFDARVAGRRAEVKGVGNPEIAESVCPREVEAVLEHHPGIADVAINGLPVNDRGEVVCAAIVGRGDETPSLEELREFCREKIGGYKIPKRMIVVDANPRNHTGKILRGELVEKVRGEGCCRNYWYTVPGFPFVMGELLWTGSTLDCLTLEII